MAINSVKIGAIESLGYSNELEKIPDDRQSLLKTFTNTGNSSVTVEDYGMVENGEIITFSAIFSDSDFVTLKNYWANRTLVRVELDDGTIINNARILIRRVQYYDNMLNKYKKVQLEVWKI